jgi:release factor glutamine methyltransferase
MSQNNIKTLRLAISKQFFTPDIDLIMAFVIRKDLVFIISNPNYELTHQQESTITQLCQKRHEGYPMAYITGKKEFFGRDFKVNETTLIPRPETELLIDQVIHLIKSDTITNTSIVDIGTGSGIIPITLIKELSDYEIKSIIASDISNKALQIAKKNATLQNVQNKIFFYKSNLLKDTKFRQDIIKQCESSLIITANLPYVNNSIKNELIQNIESKSLIYEPQIALWSKEEGLAHYKELIQQTISFHKNLTKPSQIISFYEISPEQKPKLNNYIKKYIINPHIKSYKDLSGQYRLIQFSIT